MFWENYSKIGGKVSIVTALLGVLVIFVGVIGELPHGNVARASSATTSVTVLNTPPTWDTNIYVQEAVASATSSLYAPTNSGSIVSFYASASDSSLDNYYLLICKNYASPTPVSSGPPTCSGGSSNLVAVSGATVSGFQTSVISTTTYDGDPNEIFYYYGYICDGNAINPACNLSAFSPSTNPTGGGTPIATSSPYLSPFIVNHRPTFTLYQASSTTGFTPGAIAGWWATTTDADTYGGRGTDTVKLFVCKAQDFTGSACGPAGQWGVSSFVTNYATVTFPLNTPYPKGTYGAYGYVVDNHGTHASVGVKQTTDAPLIVNNVAPTISAASVSLFSATSSSPLLLTNLATQTQNFSVQFTVTDQNSCQTASGTNEIATSTINVYRSSITQANCRSSGSYNPNNCYTNNTPRSIWNYSCTAGACAGTTSATQVWTCTFPLWYVADATDVGSQFVADNWLASASSSDTSWASSTLVESSVGTEMLQFLGYDISTTTIPYGSLQPGNSVDLIASTSLLAQGNVGLDETLYGDDMCPSYPTCAGVNTNTIFVNNQRVASSSVLYAFGTTTLGLNPGSLFALHVNKTIATATPQLKTNYWGILVPGTITLSGSYVGRNTILGVTSPSTSW